MCSDTISCTFNLSVTVSEIFHEAIGGLLTIKVPLVKARPQVLLSGVVKLCRL